jgi:hypothetical protein
MSLSQPDLQALRDEHDNDPESRNYAGAAGDAIAVHALMVEPLSQSPQVFANKFLDIADLAFVLMEKGKWEAIVAEHDDTASVNAAHDDAFLFVEAARMNVNLDFGRMANVLSSLVTVGLINSADRADVRAEGRNEVLESRHEAVLGRRYELLVSDVQDALDLP